MIKRIFLLVAMLAMMAFLAAPALAQGPPENPGVETGPDNANSECSYSGLNDFEEGPGPRTQNYGQIVGTLAKLGVHINAGPGPAAPGTECNGHLAPLQEGR